MFSFLTKPAEMIRPEDALPGRPDPIPTAERHHVFDRPLDAPVPAGMAQVMLGMGCFWGAERLFWQTPGVWLTRVGYAGGFTPNPTYEEVCSGRTGHTEVVHVVFDPAALSFDALLRSFWESHDPTQGMRQGNDRGTQYRSALYTFGAAQQAAAEASRDAYAGRLRAAGHGAITTEVTPAPVFFHAEAYHQQYLSKNPAGYCGIGGTGVACPVGASA
ncbi:MAG: peptide-methionine (S)-S-oxide reductase MsrA [Rhodobacteraceae bacterium]|nr:peptide-methionine (S)-S-oxide reductase MsrA [Paracoccaceae bacterium]